VYSNVPEWLAFVAKNSELGLISFSIFSLSVL
jgi:hypothetical protein